MSLNEHELVRPQDGRLIARHARRDALGGGGVRRAPSLEFKQQGDGLNVLVPANPCRAFAGRCPPGAGVDDGQFVIVFRFPEIVRGIRVAVGYA